MKKLKPSIGHRICVYPIQGSILSYYRIVGELGVCTYNIRWTFYPLFCERSVCVCACRGSLERTRQDLYRRHPHLIQCLTGPSVKSSKLNIHQNQMQRLICSTALPNTLNICRIVKIWTRRRVQYGIGSSFIILLLYKHNFQIINGNSKILWPKLMAYSLQQSAAFYFYYKLLE